MGPNGIGLSPGSGSPTGDGGPGREYHILGAPYYFGGGGGGAGLYRPESPTNITSGDGGRGGGAAGSNVQFPGGATNPTTALLGTAGSDGLFTATPATVFDGQDSPTVGGDGANNTGGGGGGAGNGLNQTTGTMGGNGGSGIFVIAYPTP